MDDERHVVRCVHHGHPAIDHIFGRTTHAVLATLWPTAGTTPDASADLIEQARLMNTLPKYVLTHEKEERTGWANSHPLALNNVPGSSRSQRGQSPCRTWEIGSSAAPARRHRRGPPYSVSAHLGRRDAALAADGKRRILRLAATERFGSGATMHRYRFA